MVFFCEAARADEPRPREISRSRSRSMAARGIFFVETKVGYMARRICNCTATASTSSHDMRHCTVPPAHRLIRHRGETVRDHHDPRDADTRGPQTNRKACGGDGRSAPCPHGTAVRCRTRRGTHTVCPARCYLAAPAASAHTDSNVLLLCCCSTLSAATHDLVAARVRAGLGRPPHIAYSEYACARRIGACPTWSGRCARSDGSRRVHALPFRRRAR
jgi:hypothetical protein